MSIDRPERRAVTVTDILEKARQDAAERAAGRLPARKNISASNALVDITMREFQRSSAAAVTMTEHRAALPPSVVHTLRVLIDRDAFPSDHVKWVEDGVRKILERWELGEDPVQLRSDLGLVGPKRRKERTVRRETMIAAAVADAALAGSANPRKTAHEEFNRLPGIHPVSPKDVRLAWEAWAPVYIARLFELMSSAPAKERTKIRRAIAVLETLSKNKK